MPNRLNIPKELDELIEKREQEDRRQAQENKSDSRTEGASRRMEVPKERRRGKGRRENDRS